MTISSSYGYCTLHFQYIYTRKSPSGRTKNCTESKQSSDCDTSWKVWESWLDKSFYFQVVVSAHRTYVEGSCAYESAWTVESHAGWRAGGRQRVHWAWYGRHRPLPVAAVAGRSPLPAAARLCPARAPAAGPVPSTTISILELGLHRDSRTSSHYHYQICSRSHYTYWRSSQKAVDLSNWTKLKKYNMRMTVLRGSPVINVAIGLCHSHTFSLVFRGSFINFLTHDWLC